MLSQLLAGRLNPKHSLQVVRNKCVRVYHFPLLTLQLLCQFPDRILFWRFSATNQFKAGAILPFLPLTEAQVHVYCAACYLRQQIFLAFC